MLGFLPPSSSATFFTVAAAAAMIACPVARPPVKETMSTAGCSVSGAPTVGAGAEHEVDHARRQPGLGEQLHEQDRRCDGVSSLGLSTNVQPAASAGATFHDACSSG